MADTAKQLADAEKNHNRLKKLGTKEATKEFGSYPKYIDALKESMLKLNDAKADHEDSASGEAKEPTKAKEPWEMTKAERGTPDANHASRGVFKTKKDAEANLAELMGKLNKSPQTKAILDQFGMDSSNTYQVVKSKKLSNRWGIAATHHHEIANAIQLGKSVPAEVLADYPDLVKKPEKKPEAKKEKVEEKEPSEMTPEEASRKLDVLLRAPQKETGKPRVSFATKTEEEAFRKGFQQGSKTPHGDPPLRRAGMSHPKDIKYFDAQHEGWSHGAIAGREIEKLRNDINENKTVSATAVDTYGIKLPEGYIKGGGSYVREQSAPLKPEPVEEKPKPAAETGAKGKQVEQMTPEQSAATAKFRIGDGWKLHLNVPEDANDPLTQAISKTLTDLGVKHKVGRNSGQAGKGMTVYVGSKDAAKAIAARLENEHTLPASVNLPEDAPWSQGVNARFDISRANRDYHQYGFGGTPVLNQDVSDAWGEPGHGFTAANASKAHQVLAKLYGSFYTGQSAPAPIPKPTTATPPKEPVAEVKEMKEKPKPTHWKDYYEPIASKLEKSPKTKKNPGSSWNWPPRPGDAPIEELAAQRKPEITQEVTLEEAGQEQFAPLEVNPDAPKEKAEFDVTPEQHKNIRDEWKKLDEINDLGKKNRQEGVQDPEVMKRYKEQKKVLDNVLTKAGLPALPKSHQDVFPGRTPPPEKYTVNGGASGLRQIGTNKSKEKRAKKAEDRMAKVDANIEATQVKPKELPVVPSPVTPEKDLKAGEATGSEDAKPSATDQKTGDGVPPPEKATESKKVLAPSTSDQANQIYTASASADNSLQALNNLPNGHPDREEYYQRYIIHRMMLSKLLEAAGHDPLLQTGNLKVLKQDHGLPKEMLQGANNYRKTQEDKNDLKFYLPDEPESPGPQPQPQTQAPAPVASDKEEKFRLFDEEEEDIPPKAPVQRIEPTVTPPRIESIVGSKSPLPQTQPQPQAQVPAPVAPVVPAATVPAGAAPVVPTTPPAPAEAAPVAPAPWFPLGPGKGQVTWPPQPTAGVAPAPVAPSGRGSQAASQAAAASGAKPVDQGQFAPSKPQPQQQPEAPAPAPWFPFGQGNGQAPWPPQNDQAIPAPVPQPVPPAPAPAPPGKQPAPAPAPAQPLQQPVPGQPQQKPGTPQPKPPFNPFQRTEPTPAQPKPKPPFNPFQRIEDKVAPRTSRPKQQPGTKTQPVPVPVPVPGKPQQEVPLQPMSRLEKVKKALASVGQGIGQAATNASQSVQRAATHGITKAVLAHLGVAALHGINYHKAIKNLGPKQPRKFNPGWHGFTTPVGKPEDEAKAAEQQKAAPEPKEAAEPKTSGKWERRDR